MNYKEIILSNIIGLNPTGTLDFNGTYRMNGNNNIVKDASTASKDNLLKATNNKIICNHVENFENYNNFNNKNNKNNSNYIKNIILIIILLIILFILFLI